MIRLALHPVFGNERGKDIAGSDIDSRAGLALCRYRVKLKTTKNRKPPKKESLMLEIIHDMPDNVVGVCASGKVTGED